MKITIKKGNKLKKMKITTKVRKQTEKSEKKETEKITTKERKQKAKEKEVDGNAIKEKG